eukprot:TRINITY_DN7035_c0_g1_i1.p2 TRINITY_DN7035_c0_g1~~TRINITY_DN7035_c0_g1_i1.p2  ORF type:complete len:153 (+),score=20.30 TRINITY_DN7035_c0_g1_i1:1004-1462(+)
MKLYDLCKKVILIRLFPGMDRSMFSRLEKYEGIIVEAYGAGNVPSELFEELEWLANTNQTVVIVVTQCIQGTTSNSYATGVSSNSQSGNPKTPIVLDMTPEAAFTKLSVLLGCQNPGRKDESRIERARRKMRGPHRGECHGTSSKKRKIDCK